MPSTTFEEQLINGLNNIDLVEKKTSWFNKFFSIKLSNQHEIASSYVQARNWDKAVDAYQALLSRNPEDIALMTTLAEVYLKKGQKNQAFTLFEKVVKIHTQEGQISAATALLARVAEMVPGDARPRERLVRLLIQASEQEKNTANEARFRDQALVELRRMINQQHAQRDFECTIRYLRAVSNLDPRDLGTAKRLVALLQQKGRDGEAMVFLRNLVDRLMERGLDGVAEKVIYEGLRLDNGNPSMKALFYLVQLKEGFGNDVLIGLERLHQQHPHDVEVVKVLARVEMKLERQEIAAKWLTAAFRIDPSQTMPLMNMGRKMLEQGKVGVAFDMFEALAEHAWSMGKAEIGLNLLEPIFNQDKNHLPTLRAMTLYSLRAKREQDAMYYLDQATAFYTKWNRLPDLQMFVRQTLAEFPENKALWERIRILDKKVNAA